ncbi:MAG: hypothetical protein WCB44_26365, partial [Stellaceae bacterium]
HGIDPPLCLKASPPSNRVVSTSEVGGSYIRILRSDSAVFGGRQFVTLIFGEERREQPHPWERLVPRR